MAAALLFDLDGTLIQSDPLHLRVFRGMFAEHGVALAGDDYDRHILGSTNERIFRHFLPGRDWRALSDEKEVRFRALLGEARATPGLVPLLDRAAAAGWRVGVVTNAPRANAGAMLAAIGLAGRFPVIVAEGDAPRGKPDPAPYALGLRLLGVPPAAALAFEDSVPGVTAASGAGIFTVGLRSSLSDEPLRAAGAALTLRDFADPGLEAALARLSP